MFKGLYSRYKFNKLRNKFADSNSEIKFNDFMIHEHFALNKKYLKNNVIINNIDNFKENIPNGGIVVFLHYGSFFITGAALVNQSQCNYTAIASLRNVHGNTKIFWQKFHDIANNFYSTDMFLDGSYPYKMIKWLNDDNFLGVALDVHTKRRNQQLKMFRFGSDRVLFDDYATRIGRMTGKPIIASVISYDKRSSRQILKLSDPIYDYENAVQISLDFIYKSITDPSQFYHDIKFLFGVRDVNE